MSVTRLEQVGGAFLLAAGALLATVGNMVIIGAVVALVGLSGLTDGGRG